MSPRSPAPCAQNLLRGLLLYTLVISVLLLGRPLAEALGPAAGLLASFAVACALVLGFLPAERRSELRPTGPRVLALGFSLVAGFALLPALLQATRAVGALLPMPPSPVPGIRASLGLYAGVLVLGPLFEESLYRQQLLVTLRDRFGSPAGVLVSSSLFAITHVEPWFVLGSFLVGLCLSALMLITRSVWPCVGLHAGLNLAGLRHGPLEGVLPEAGDPLASSALGMLALIWVAHVLRVPALRKSAPGGGRSGEATAS